MNMNSLTSFIWTVFVFIAATLSHDSDIGRNCKEHGYYNLFIGSAIQCELKSPDKKDERVYKDEIGEME